MDFESNPACSHYSLRTDNCWVNHILRRLLRKDRTGFTHLGSTGITGPLPPRSDPEGLNTSATDVALTLCPVLPQIREKKLGKPARVICTVTSGLTPNWPPPLKLVQSATGVAVPAL